MGPARWIGWGLTGLFAAFLLIASIGPKMLGARVARDSFAQLGWPEGYVLLVGAIELTGLAFYLFPRTSVLGAVLLTGLLGGAIATHLRAESPLFSHTLFGVYLGIAMWGGLWLRDPVLRSVFPSRPWVT